VAEPKPADCHILSVVIPTCNRSQYLESVVRSILTTCSNTEIIVSDNSDTDALRSTLACDIAAGRVIYSFHAEPLSVVDNFERARRMANGEYLLFIGDDDTVGPGIEDVCRWAKTHDVDAVVSYRTKFLANYFWPGVKSKYFGDKYSATLFINRFSGKAWPIDGKKQIAKICDRPGAGLGAMPRAYHGILSKQLADAIADKYGSLFGGVSPDIYSATLISHEARRPHVVDYPFVVPGGSPVSTAGQGAARLDMGDFNAFDHIRRFGSGLVWDARIPKFYSPTTVWAYSLQKALDRLPEGPKEINYPGLYLKCAVRYHSQQAHIRQSFRQWMASTGSPMSLCMKAIHSSFIESCLFVYRQWNRFGPNKPLEVRPLENIEEASAALNRHVRDIRLDGRVSLRP